MNQPHVGLVGSGGITRAHVPAWLNLGAKVTVFSLEGAEELAAQFGIDVVASLEELLELCDVVDICTPTTSHRDIALAAAGAGKDVVCEKPLGRTAEEGRQIRDAVTLAGTKLYPGHVVRYFPAYVAAKEAVDAGRLGNLAVLRFSRGGAGPTSPWFYDMEKSGGIVMDQMIHDLDQALWLAGPVKTVYAVQNIVPAASGPLPNMSAQVTLTHTSGAISHVLGYWGPPNLPFRTSFRLAGSEGALEHDSGLGTGIDKHLAVSPNVSYLPPAGREESPYLTEIREFAEAFAGVATSRVTVQDGIAAVAIAQAALRSIETGQPETLTSEMVGS